MNNQLKLLLYILFLVGAFIYIQDSFNIFDISFKENTTTNDDSNSEKKQEDVIKKDRKNYVEIYISDGESIKVDVEVADDSVSRTLGLSNRRYLGDYNGMLFIFEEKGNYPFWMKDTLIPLDIIFIDEFGFIVDIVKDNQPCGVDHCPQIFSLALYKYALEVNAGFSDLNGVSVGKSLAIYLASSN
jgi:uncharacterized protein